MPLFQEPFLPTLISKNKRVKAPHIGILPPLDGIASAKIQSFSTPGDGSIPTLASSRK
jgi:hypothetical protein